MKCIVRNITVPINDNPPFALSDISFSLGEGDILAVVGKSGAGKTTLLNVLAGFLPIKHGAIILDDQTVSCATYNVDPIKRNVGIIFQDHNLLPHLPLYENMLLGMSEAERRARNDEIEALMHDLHIHDLKNQYPSSVSGGQQQRVALGRSLLHHKKLLLFDEPFSGLDKPRMSALAAHIRSTVKKYGRIALLVTHQMDEAFLIADKIAIMKEGKLLQLDTPQNIYHNPKDVFIANLLGPTNIVPATVTDASYASTLFGTVSIIVSHPPTPNSTVSLLTRPDDWQIKKNPHGPFTVQDVMFMGMHKMLTVVQGDQTYQVLADHHLTVLPGEKVTLHLQTHHPYRVLTPTDR